MLGWDWDWDCGWVRSCGAEGACLCGVYVLFGVVVLPFALPLRLPLLLLYTARFSGVLVGYCMISPESMRCIGATCFRRGILKGKSV